MANAIRYSTTGDTQSLKSGNFFFGVGDVGKGPSSATTYYNGVTPVVSGYTIYTYNASQTSKISFASANNDSELVTITNNLSGQNFTTATQCLNWYVTQSNYVCVNKDYENIVTNGLILSVDAGFTPSYTTSGTTWYDLAYSGYNNSLLNGLTYTPQYSGGLIFDNTNDYVQVNTVNLNSLGATRNYTICFSCIKEFFGTGGNLAGDSALIIGGANGYDSGWRIREDNLGTPGGAFSGRHSFTHGAPTTTNFLTVLDGVNIHRPVYLCYSISTGTTFGYCNGSVSSRITGTYSNGSSYGTIGLGTYGVGYFGGKIYNYQIYNRALTLTEIKQNYLAFLDRFVGKNLVTDNLSFYLDANYRGSYPTSGTTWADVSGNNINGTLTNGPTYSTDGGGSIVFDGIDDRVSLTDTQFTTKGPWTILLWVNSNDMTKHIHFTGVPNIDTGGWAPLAHYGAGLEPYKQAWWDSNGWRYSSTPFSGNSWHQVGLYYNGNNTIGFILDGKYDNETSGGNLFNPIARIASLGYRQHGGDRYYNGKMANVEIYTRQLTQSEVLQNYQAQFPTILGENIITNGLVLYLDAGYSASYPTTGTTWTNVSGVSGGTGTLTNGPTYDSGNGGSIVFDGIDDKVDCGDSPTFRLSSTLTIQVIFNINTYTSWAGLIGKNSNIKSVYGLNLSPTSQRLRFNYNNVSPWTNNVETTSTISTNQWIIAAVTYDGETVKFYINGVLDKTQYVGPITFDTSAGYPLDIGWDNPGGDEYFNGKIAQASIYSRALTQNEIQQNFNAQKSRYGL